jgi:hypothetical protein
MVQFMHHVNSWRNVKKSITHYNVYKVKGYFNFHISNLELSKKKKRVQIILISEQCNECYNYEQYLLFTIATSHLQT